MSGHRRPALALAAWIALLGVTLAGLHALGDGPLAAPSPSGLGPWLADRGAVTAAFALLRLGLLVTACYLLASTVLATVLHLARADTAARAVEACAPVPVRRLVRAAAGLSIAASVVVTSSASAREADAPVTMRRLPDAGAPEPAPPVTMVRLPDRPAIPPAAAAAEAEAAPTIWRVAPGDHLWSIARRSLSSVWRREPTDAEVDPYWRQLIAANRSRLPDPTNPDLIVPALELVVPAVPAPPAR